MSRYIATQHVKRRFSLSVYISFILALTAIVPLLVIIGSVEFFLKPALVNQVRADMEKDTRTRIQMIDAYFADRLNDIKTLSESVAVKELLAGNQKSTQMALNVLTTAQHRDVANYISLTLLGTQGNLVLSYPSAPFKHGEYYILPQALQQLQQSGKVVISDVFYNQVGNAASVDLYVRVIDGNFQLLGYVRASLGLHRIWEAVDAEPQANGPNSYAVILDQNGVRIGYTNPDHSGFTHPPSLFKAIAPLSPTLQQRIKDENLYGNSTTAVTTMADEQLARILSNAQAPTLFQIQPVEQKQNYEAARSSSSIVPWTYIIFKPSSVVTGIADQQLFSIILIIAAILLLSIPIGLITGQRIALPILRSVVLLRRNSQSLRELANDEHTVAKEQSWMVEASQSAQEAVKYYTKAASIAAQRIHTIGNELTYSQQSIDAHSLKGALNEITEAAAYIERAIHLQESMNEKLTTALRVTTQATEQLTQGAKSTNDAAAQLEDIVNQITAVVGKSGE